METEEHQHISPDLLMSYVRKINRELFYYPKKKVLELESFHVYH